MKTDLELLQLHAEWFKGIRSLTIDFGKVTELYGRNAVGKTTIYDAFNFLMFGKDSSGRDKFAVRPLDENGNVIHNVETVVSGVLRVNGERIELKKTQKEKWVKKRGAIDSEFQGYTNLYEYQGVPKKEKEYKEIIDKIIPEDDFKFLTDIKRFSDLDVKEKRNFLLKLVPEVTDEEILKNPQYAEIAQEVTSLGTVDAKTRLMREKKLLEQRQIELPVRVDELSKQLQDVPDVSIYSSALNEGTAKIADLQAELANVKVNTAYADLAAEKANIVNSLNALDRRAREQKAQEESEIRAELNKATSKDFELKKRLSDLKRNLEMVESEISESAAERQKMGDEYNATKALVFDTDSAVCPYCHRPMEGQALEECRSNFETEKASKMKLIKAKATQKFQVEKEKIAKRDHLQTEITTVEKEIPVAEEALKKAEERLKAFDPTVKVDTEETRNLQKRLDALESEIIACSGDSQKTQELQNQIVRLQMENSRYAEAITKSNAIAEKNDALRARIKELEAEQKENGLRIALNQKKLNLLEAFGREKSTMLRDRINGKFELARFELFENQVNGGMKEICEVSYNGVKYNDLNSGHRVVVGMDIIRTFQRFMGISCPVWVDNAESVNDDNFPKMDCQVIKMSVRDNPTLEVKTA